MKIFQFLFLGNFSITNAQSVNLFTQNRKPNPEKTIVANDELKTIGLNTPPDSFSFNGRESFEDFEKIIQQLLPQGAVQSGMERELVANADNRIV